MPTLALRNLLIVTCTALAGCSLALNFETSQCETDADCVALGAEECSEGSCVFVESDDAGSQSVSIASSEANNSSEAGAASDVETTAPHAGAGGAGGSTAAPQGCTSTEQCVADNRNEPYICPEPGAECLSLKTPECPLTFGDYDDDNALFVGAFLNLPASAPLSQMSVLNVKLAIKEFESAGGLPGGPLRTMRPLVMVACRNEPDLLGTAADHLINEVGVPAILAHLPSAELKELFVDYALPTGTFVINPGFADNSLTSLSSDGLFWHVIGDIRDVAPAYGPLLQRVETYVRGDSTEDLRVGMLVADRYAEQNIMDEIVPVLEFNGKSVSDNGSNFFSATVTPMADDPDADYSEVNTALLDFVPNIVIVLTREEFVYSILPVIEQSWPYGTDAPPRPFYIVPTALSGNLDLLDFVSTTSYGATSGDKISRIVGVAPASAEDMSLYEQFLVRFRTAYPSFENPAGFENFYDAVYLLANAMYAAGSVPEITGADIARGMQRVVAGELDIDIGPSHISDGFSVLATGGAIRLNGTMGPSDFDPGVGARRGSGSVYCYLREGTTVTIAYDVLRYDQDSGELVGELPCFEGF